jgi:3-dehydroquinate synthetase
VTLAGASVAAVLAATARDKKRTGEQLPFVLVDEPGSVRTGCAVSPDDLAEAVAELGG